MKWLSNNLIDILMYVSIAFCLWAIFAVQLQWIPFVEVSLTQETCDKLNIVYVNLSYSFLAAFFFYLLTIVFPRVKSERKIKCVLRKRIDAIQRKVADIVLEFSRNIDKSKVGDLKYSLKSKSWTDNIPMYQYLYHANISYIALIAEVGSAIRKDAMEMIQLYREFMTEGQIIEMEEFVDMQIFHISKQFSQMNMNLDEPDGKESLVEMFVEMHEKINEIADSFK